MGASDCLLVVNHASTPSLSELACESILEDLGYTVTMRSEDDTPTQATDESTYVLLLVHGDSSGNIADKYQSHAIPTVVSAQFLYNEFLLTSGNNNALTGTQIREGGADVTVYSTAATIGYASSALPAAAVVHGYLTDGTTPCIFSLESGELLIDGATAAPAHRGGFFCNRSFNLLTASGEQLFIEAVQRAHTLAPQDPPTISSYTANPTTIANGATSTLTVVAAPATPGNTLTYDHDIVGGNGALTGDLSDFATLTGSGGAAQATHTVHVTVLEAETGRTASAQVSVVEQAPVTPGVPTVDSVTLDPASAQQGNLIHVVATASPPSGETLSAWQWRLDGGGSSLAAVVGSFFMDTSTVDIGSHTVEGRVQDSAGTWSDWWVESFGVIAATDSVGYPLTLAGNYEPPAGTGRLRVRVVGHRGTGDKVRLSTPQVQVTS